jgi:hypothetical protein
MEKIAAPSTIGAIGAVEREPAAIGAHESCIVRERNTPMKTIIVGDESAIGVEDPRQPRTGVLPHGRVPSTAHGTEAGEVVGKREAGNDPS